MSDTPKLSAEELAGIKAVSDCFVMYGGLVINV